MDAPCRELATAARLRADAEGRSVQGATRAENFDVFFADAALGLFVVVDGQIDRRAAPIALRAFVEGMRVAQGRGQGEGALSNAALAAHNALLAEAPNTAAELAAVWIAPGGVRVCSVGAARCHREHEGVVELLTMDDVLCQNVVSLWPWPDPMPADGDFDAWDPTPRILGGPRAPRVCELAADVVAGDTLLVSTDGLTWSAEDEDRVVNALVRGRGEVLARVLDAVMPAPGETDDDATALLVRCAPLDEALAVGPARGQSASEADG